MILIFAIEDVIKELGLANKEVCIHSSMKTFGDEIEGDATSIIDAFLEQNCTVMVPTFRTNI